MNDREADLLKRLLKTFRIEAEEHLATLTAKLLALEKEQQPDQRQALVEIIFRETHSMKGASRAVNLTGVETICQQLESIFADLKREKLVFSERHFDQLYQVIDRLKRIIFPPENVDIEEIKLIDEAHAIIAQMNFGENGTVEKRFNGTTPSEIVHDPDSEIKPSVPLPEIPMKPENRGMPADETIRISVRKLSQLLNKVENLLSIKLSNIQRVEDFQNSFKQLNVWNTEVVRLVSVLRTLQKHIEQQQAEDKLGACEKEFGKVIQFFDWSESYLKSFQKNVLDLKKKVKQDAHQVGSMIDNLMEDVKSAMSIPFKTLLDLFPKTVRDLSRDQGKKVDWVVKGEDIEIDRRILEEIKSPLLHLVRNCIDHGIEKPDLRAKLNKPERGTITVIVENLESNKIGISVSDDGGGIPFDKLKKKYIDQYHPSKAEQDKLSDARLTEYIFQSGVTASEFITDISGRGLGLAIVREKIERLGGSVTVESQKDSGTTFRITLPMTLVTFRGVLIRVSDRKYIMPTVKVARILRIPRKQIKTVENKDTLSIDGEVISLIHLGNILGLPPGTADVDDFITVMIFGTAGNRIGFRIDEIVNEQEVMVKNFGKQLSRVKYFTGAAILGSGEVVPLLNVSDLIAVASKEDLSKAPARSAGIAKLIKKKTALVVEDSITSRMLLKNILETAGYDVKTAVDGMEGLATLREGNFDILVSDIDMPRMNGFELTTKVRDDKKLSELPVVLVTSLQSREDRERGMDVGANAYIVKSSFDQSNLLEVIRRLI